MSRLRWVKDMHGWTAWSGFESFAIVGERNDGSVFWSISRAHLPRPLTHRGETDSINKARRMINHRFKRWIDHIGLRPIDLKRDDPAQAMTIHTLIHDLAKGHIRITDYRPGGSPKLAKEALIASLKAGLGDQEPYLLWGDPE